jgi:hypothetical protein
MLLLIMDLTFMGMVHQVRYIHSFPHHAAAIHPSSLHAVSLLAHDYAHRKVLGWKDGHDKEVSWGSPAGLSQRRAGLS